MCNNIYSLWTHFVWMGSLCLSVNILFYISVCHFFIFIFFRSCKKSFICYLLFFSASTRTLSKCEFNYLSVKTQSIIWFYFQDKIFPLSLILLFDLRRHLKNFEDYMRIYHHNHLLFICFFLFALAQLSEVQWSPASPWQKRTETLILASSLKAIKHRLFKAVLKHITGRWLLLSQAGHAHVCSIT